MDREPCICKQADEGWLCPQCVRDSEAENDQLASDLRETRDRLIKVDAERDDYRRLRDVAAQIARAYEMGWRRYRAALQHALRWGICRVCPVEREDCLTDPESFAAFPSCADAAAKEMARLHDLPVIPIDAPPPVEGGANDGNER